MRTITVTLIGPERAASRGDPGRKVWRARYVDLDGIRHGPQIGVTSGMSKAKAQKIVQAMQVKLSNNGTPKKLGRVTVAQLVELYIAEKREGWTPKTLKENVNVGRLLLQVGPAQPLAAVEHPFRRVEPHFNRVAGVAGRLRRALSGGAGSCEREQPEV